MARNKGTIRTKSRYKLKKEVRRRGKISMSAYFQSFNIGDKVHLVAEPSIQKGMYFVRFMGRVGEITGKSGKCYKIKITDGGKEKTLISHPVHLKRAK
jgi:large subunit ribosomal protein L21e